MRFCSGVLLKNRLTNTFTLHKTTHGDGEVHHTPEYVGSDNALEFAAEALQGWLRRVGIKPIRIYPGSSCEIGYNERLNGTLRREVLNTEWFTRTKQAPIILNLSLRQYNHTCSHQALNMRPPVPETR